MIQGFVWVVPARIIRWKDGDTCEVVIDQGWRMSRDRESIRVYQYSAPELTELGGPEALAFAMGLLPAGTVVSLHSKAVGRTALWGGSQESLSRTLADIRLLDGRDFARTMVANGHGQVTV